MNNSAANTARLLGAGARALLALTLLCGVLYPLAVTGVAQVFLSDEANGSEVRADGRTVGSALIGQRYDLPPRKGQETAAPDLRWFQPRPSNGLGANSVNTRYELLVSGATNLAGDSEELIEQVRAAKAAVIKDNSTPGHEPSPAEIPADAVTSSGSGLDPHISPAYADLQARRVAARNHVPVARVEQLVDAHTEGRTLGFIGEPRVNVLELNVALKALVAADGRD
ncbi:potassium-transporting ATPase subunit C [Streptomyces sp. NPDC050703]|uniref:potassium-transporting ATPase subunit C n=1 Tax=Streptomyces sp. NPDC050703 TaxID=3157218 RepID=UPI003412C3E8